MLAYQLLFELAPTATRTTEGLIVIALLGVVAALSLVPISVLRTSWFNGMLVGIDTTLVTGTIYLSGNARSDLYLTYFILMLIAASLRRLSHVLAVSLLLCTGYGLMLYQGIAMTGTISAGHLLGVPVLLVMAVFYGMAMQSVGLERQQTSKLRHNIRQLKSAEVTLQNSLAQLEMRVNGLKQDLASTQTDLQQGQVERHGLERQLAEAQKMEAVGQITTGIAAEFSRLCSVIGKQTGVMLSRLRPEDPLYGPVDEIFKSGELAATLTAQLALLDNRTRQLHHVLSVSSLLEELSGAIRSLLSANIDCHISSDPLPLLAEMDREGLEQILLNVVVNARDAMPGGGRMTISAAHSQGPQCREGTRRIRWVRVEISDTGSGMNREIQSRMFEPFFSTKETNIGLGLTAVYGIVKQHGGEVEVSSQPGRGTVVRIYLPLADRSESKTQAVAPSLCARGDETILLVEPHEVARKLALGSLLRHRYKVLEASSSVEALLMVQHHAGGVHMTISELTMPDIGGRDLARRLLKQFPTMRTLFVSGYDDDAMCAHRINRKCLLRRPYRQSGLIEKVRELLDG